MESILLEFDFEHYTLVFDVKSTSFLKGANFIAYRPPSFIKIIRAAAHQELLNSSWETKINGCLILKLKPIGNYV